jgi:hypothetical protein
MATQSQEPNLSHGAQLRISNSWLITTVISPDKLITDVLAAHVRHGEQEALVITYETYF